MSDTKSWIEERRAIHRDGWSGKWSWSLNDRELATLRATGSHVDFDLIRDDEFRGPSEVLDEIIDAHNVTVPRALNALEQVLEEHSRQGFYEPCDQTTCALDGGHDHIEVDYGEWVHADERVGWACFTCRGEDCAPIDWPCATVQAIEGAINHE